MQEDSFHTLSGREIEEAAELFSTLSEPARLLLIRALMPGPSTVCDLVEKTGMKQGNVSKHLNVLYRAKLLGRERDGNFVRYSIADPTLFRLCELVCGRIREG